MQLTRIPVPAPAASSMVLEMTASVRVSLKEKVAGDWIVSDEGVVTAFLRHRAGMDGRTTCTISFDRARPAILGLELDLTEASFFVLKLANDPEVRLEHRFKPANLTNEFVANEFAVFAASEDLKPLAYQAFAELKRDASFS